MTCWEPFFKCSNKGSAEDLKTNTIQTLEEIRSGVRAISHELMPPNFQFTDLNEMLADYFSKMQEISGISIQYTPYPHTDWSSISEHIGYEIYRIMQETTGNILKHTQAKVICIQIEKNATYLIIEVHHDGNWSPHADLSKGIGLRTINDRLKTIAGDYKIEKRQDWSEYSYSGASSLKKSRFSVKIFSMNIFFFAV